MTLKTKHIFTYTNLALVIIENLLILWTWYKSVTADSDTMFMGLLLIPLIFVTIYYLGLLQWAFRLLQKIDSDIDKRLSKNIALLFMNVIPIILIYKLTT